MSKAVFDYVKVETVATQLRNANTDLVSQIQALQNTVTALLSSGGGLYMEQSSPALHNAYVQFNTSLTNAMNGISNFAQQFTQIKDQLAQFDGDTHKAVVSSSSGGGK